MAYTLWLLHHLDYDELTAGQLALANAGSQAVKALGKTLVTDHQIYGQKVVATARKLNVDLEPHVTGGDKLRLDRMKKKLDELESLKGTRFDSAFAGLMEQSHREAIEVVKEALGDPQQQGIQPLLQELLPRLEAHRKVAATLVVQGDAASAR